VGVWSQGDAAVVRARPNSRGQLCSCKVSATLNIDLERRLASQETHVIISLTMGTVHRGHHPGAPGDKARCTQVYSPSAEYFCQQVREAVVWWWGGGRVCVY
jgi:hypothetical protein